MSSQARAYAFTLGYVWERRREACLLILDNAYRLFDHPVNGYRWDYPISIEWQVRLHHLIVVLALGAVALSGARNPASLPVFLIPACLGILHGLTFPWPRYSQSAIFILFAGAASFGMFLVRQLPAGGGGWRLPAGVLGLGLAFDLTSAGLLDNFPEGARFLAMLGVSLALASPFLAIVRAHPRTRERVAPALRVALPLSMSLAHSMRGVRESVRRIRALDRAMGRRRPSPIRCVLPVRNERGADVLQRELAPACR